GTSREEIGNGVHYGTRSKLREEGIPVGNHRAVQLLESDYKKYDYLIGMDGANMRNMERIVHGDPKHKLFLLLDFTS
ncbi:low molecular weight phosphotyrosine protein phosphatase, partial [Erysipelatoclostridium ramosum]|nr:low molecular weight phosphotyrosine protein phosphatase [Thomasclavelia ramosa]